jgi:Asp-tRNA(Asn)/Glu-tRNA(Gln) amidotransferase A subunit family amidase
MSSQLPQYGDLDAAAIARLVRARELSCLEVVGAANETIERHDCAVRAFAAQAGAIALARARELDRVGRERAARMPLLGVPVAVGDTFDTADLPTAYGSPIYGDHRPHADAALVSLLRAAGAVVVGKAKIAEFGCLEAPDTRNPLDPGRTPGGSSSGSAAAVAARLVPLAIGTQSAGCVVRAASYCGVFGLKPTFGVVPLAGALPISTTLDTAGLFARSVDDLELALAVVGAAPAGSASARAGRALDGAGNGRLAAASSPRIALLRLAWTELETQARETIERYLEAAAAAGARIEEASLPVPLERLVAAQQAIERAEKAHTLGPEVDRHGDAVSAQLRAYLAEAQSVAREDYLAARRLADEQRWRWHERFAAFDAVLAPATLGVPPAGLEQVGDPLLCRPFTLLGVPALALPGAWTVDGLPVGLQLAGVLHGDRRVLAVARWLRARACPRASGAPDSANAFGVVRAAE